MKSRIGIAKRQPRPTSNYSEPLWQVFCVAPNPLSKPFGINDSSGSIGWGALASRQRRDPFRGKAGNGVQEWVVPKANLADGARPSILPAVVIRLQALPVRPASTVQQQLAPLVNSTNPSMFGRCTEGNCTEGNL